jgi:hypothetical protein
MPRAPQKATRAANTGAAKTRRGKSRAKPGSKGGGHFFHIELRPSGEFTSFRVQDVGRRVNGSWDTAKWLVEKTHAHLADGRLVADSLEAEKLLNSLGSVPVHVGGDRFRAKPRRDIPESEKPTPAMRRAQAANIKKAQAAQRRKRTRKARGRS